MRICRLLSGDCSQTLWTKDRYDNVTCEQPNQPLPSIIGGPRNNANNSRGGNYLMRSALEICKL